MKTPLKSFFSFAESWKRLAALFAGIMSCLLFLGKPGTIGTFLSCVSFFPLVFVLWRLGEGGFFLSAVMALGMLLLKGAFVELVVFSLFYLLPVFLLGRLMGKDLFRLKKEGRSPLKVKKPTGGQDLGLFLEMKLFYFFCAGGALFILCVVPFVGELLQKGFFDSFLGNLPEGASRDAAKALLPYLPALMGIFWAGLLWANLLGVRFALKRMGIQGTFRLSAARWTLPSFAYGVLAVVMAGALFAPGEMGLLARNWLPFAVCPFLVEGFVLVLQMYRRFLGHNIGELLLMVGLVFLGWPLLFIVVLGVFEPWSNLRRRLDLHHKGES